MKRLIALSLLLVNIAFAEEIPKDLIEKYNLPDDKKAALMNLIMMDAEMGANRKILMKALVPKILSTGKEGLKFKSISPIIGTIEKRNTFYRYGNNPSMIEAHYEAQYLILNCTGCFESTKSSNRSYQYKFYPTYSEFTILQIVGTLDQIYTIVRDSEGKHLLLREHALKGLIENPINFQNEEFTLLELLKAGQDKIETVGKTKRLTKFQKDLKAGQTDSDFPPFPLKFPDDIPASDIQGWLEYAVQGFTGRPARVLKVSNIRKEDGDDFFDLSIDPESYAMLLHTLIIYPGTNTPNTGKAMMNRLASTPKILGEDTDSFFKRIKGNLTFPEPTPEEKKRAADILYKEKMKDLQNR